jgi:hypothetical protein
MTAIGDRIRLVSMSDDPDPVPAGSEGIVTGIVGGTYPQVQVDWDSGRGLALIPGVDVWDVIG